MRDLNDLQFFVAVVTQRSFSAAARFLGAALIADWVLERFG